MDVNAAIDGRSPIHYASDYGQVEVLQYLLSIGADVDVSFTGQKDTLNLQVYDEESKHFIYFLNLNLVSR